jgi:hypothetical protein
VGRKRKAKRRLEQSRKRGTLKLKLKLAERERALAEKESELARAQYENAMIQMWRDAEPEQRAALEEPYQKTAGKSLRAVHEARIIAALQKSVARRQ